MNGWASGQRPLPLKNTKKEKFGRSLENSELLSCSDEAAMLRLVTRGV